MHTTARTVLLALAVSAVVAAIALTIIFRFLLPKTAKEAPVPAYTIGVWEGKVAVFEGNDAYPMQIFEDTVDGLPAEQRQEVINGIAVYNPDDLYRILEDYTS